MPIVIVGIVILLIIVIWLQSKGNTDTEESFSDKLGKYGEQKVQRVLEQYRKKGCVPFHDILLCHNGTYTQIDHILVTPYGVYVIETKNYSGMVKGDVLETQWVHETRKGAYDFYNPVKQNDAHLKALFTLLPTIPKQYITGFVCFVGDAGLLLSNTNGRVGSLEDFVEMLNMKVYGKTVFSKQAIQGITNVITANAVTDDVSRQKHLMQVKQKQEDSRVNVGSCPVCGKDLRIVRGKYGTFIGCTGYPKCKYKKNG